MESRFALCGRTVLRPSRPPDCRGEQRSSRMSDQRSDSTNPSLLDRESKTIHDELGFRLVFYPSGLKGPREEEWTKRDDKPEDYPAGYNVGTFTGHQVQPGRYLGDVDIDWADGVQMIKGILPVTEVGTRRDSRTISHLFYTTSQPQSTKEYSRPGGGNYVEFRGTNVDGTLGHQTFIRGKHPNGETVVFHHKGHAIRQAVHRYRHRTSGPPLVHRRHRPVRQGGNRASGYV